MSWLEVDLDPLLHILETSEDPSLLAQASTNIANLSKHEMIREELISKGCVRLLAKAATNMVDIDALQMMPSLISDLVDNVPSSNPLQNGDSSVLMLVKQRQFEYPTWVLLKEHSSNLEFYKFLDQDEEHKSRSDDIEGVRSALVGSSLYLIGGRDCNHFRFTDNCIRFKDSHNPELGWKTFELPFYSSHMKIVACKDFIYIFPGDEPFYYKGVDDNIYYRKPSSSQYPKNPSYAYKYDTVRKKGCNIELPSFPSGLRVLRPRFDPTDPASYKLDDDFWEHFFLDFRVCTSWDSKGILISMLGEDGSFYFHEPENSRWKLLPTFEPLPKFKGRLPSPREFPQPRVRSHSAVLNETLYCCDVPDSSDKTSPVLHVYNLKKGRVELSHDLPLHSLAITGLKMLPLADGELLFLGFYTEWSRYDGYQDKIKYIKVKVFKGYAKVVKEMSISLPFDIREVCDYVLIDNGQFGIESEDIARGNKVERIEAFISVKGEEENKENVRSKLLIERTNLAIEMLNSANSEISKAMALLKLLDTEAGSSEVGSPWSPELGEEFY